MMQKYPVQKEKMFKRKQYAEGTLEEIVSTASAPTGHRFKKKGGAGGSGGGGWSPGQYWNQFWGGAVGQAIAQGMINAAGGPNEEQLDQFAYEVEQNALAEKVGQEIPYPTPAGNILGPLAGGQGQTAPLVKERTYSRRTVPLWNRFSGFTAVKGKPEKRKLKRQTKLVYDTAIKQGASPEYATQQVEAYKQKRKPMKKKAKKITKNKKGPGAAAQGGLISREGYADGQKVVKAVQGARKASLISRAASGEPIAIATLIAGKVNENKEKYPGMTFKERQAAKKKAKAAKKTKAKSFAWKKEVEDKDLSSPFIIDSEVQESIRGGMQEGGLMSREGYAAGGIASRLVRKLLKRHKKNPEVESDIITIKSKIDDIDDEIGSMGDEGRGAMGDPGYGDTQAFTRNEIANLEADRMYLIEGLEEIDKTGSPVIAQMDETGFPVLDILTLGPRYSLADLRASMKATVRREERKPKQEGGEIDEQMTTLMGETEQTPTETLLPDEEMEDNFVDYIVESTLSPEDTNYLEEALATDDRLSMIFDQVVETASEFSGSGPVEGPGTEVSDSIPARLSDGEFVITAKAADQIGPDNLQGMMEQAEMDADLVDRREMAEGGVSVAEDIDEDVILPQLGVLDTSQREMLKLQLSSNPRTQYRTVYG